MHKHSKIISLVACFLTIAFSSYSQPDGPRDDVIRYSEGQIAARDWRENRKFINAFLSEKTEKDIKAIMKVQDIIGMSLAVVKHGKIIYANSFGYNNIDQVRMLKNDDIFRIASISKSFSATSIMQLVDAKKISLDDDFGKLVGFRIRNPKFPDQVITLRMVMSHTSSINDSQGYFNLDVINPDKNPDWAKCYNDYAPGADYQYCNLNYNMVGTVIERVSGERFDNYVKNHIIKPLGLYAGYNVDSLDNQKFVTLYDYDSKNKKFTPSPQAYAPRREEISKYVMGYSTPIFSPTGGMKISAIDLAKYMIMHMHNGKANGTQIISKKSSKIMQTKIADEENYGLALGTNREDIIPGEKMTGHTGSSYGLYSTMFFNQQKDFGFVVIVNGSSTADKYTKGLRTIMYTTINSLYDNLISSSKVR
ncbi:serine hydrolase domain-containing protein [Daejeonella lutea]|uniref:CubicO group peptidase, beta-lactamase class C family n=1 Tax=Daejeonella lutea TaxID=572036 RepID=A0A1T5F7W8_9SPHI|nr:serine hydrolase domain-containing protein [Daejeonella lutea]SKB92259.1 CubicO group peptidase, beta-lactamase class C family [Daejeonella lutea]